MMPPEQTPDFEPGRVVAGRYRISRLLGQGGMGAVYEAQHITLERMVALKVLLPEHARDAEVVARFMQEARAAAAIGAPGIVEVFDLGTDDGLVYLAMERLEGDELFERIHGDHPPSPAEVAQIGMEICDAVGAAHDNGIIHRDLKPQNVFLARKGRSEMVKILDFGIAKLAQGMRADAPVTRTGQVFGTPLYMAPEQLRSAKDLDARADIYAIGAILYEALAGRPPFSAESYPELVVKITTQDPEPLARLRPDLPAALVSAVERAMARDRDTRYPSTAALGADLERFLADPSASAATSGSAADSHAWADTLPSGRHPSVAPPEKPAGLATGRRLWVVAGGAAILVIGAGLAVAAGVSSEPEPEAAADAGVSEAEPSASAGEPAPPPPPPEAPAPEEDGPTTAEAPAETPPPAATAVASTPKGARVLVDGSRRCTTPCELELGDGPVELTVTKRGYVAIDRRLRPPHPETLSFELKRRRRPRPRPSSEGSSDVPDLLPR